MSGFSRGGGGGGGGGSTNGAIQVVLFAPDDFVATGTDVGNFLIPTALDGFSLSRAVAYVTGNIGAISGTTNIMLINEAPGNLPMLTGSGIVIATGGINGSGTLSGASSILVQTDYIIRIDITSISATAPKGLMVMAEFLPT